MKTFYARLFVAFVAMIFVVNSADFCFSAPCYTVMDLGTLGVHSYAFDLNENGQVVGVTNNHPFLWQESTGMQDLGGFGGSGYANAINNSGKIVGYSENSDDYRRAFLWQNSTGMQDIGASNDSYASNINNKDQVVGHANNYAFLWQNSTGMQNICENGYANAINDNGQVAGTFVDNNNYRHAFSWKNGCGVQDIGTLGGKQSSANGINANGQIVGSSYNSSSKQSAFLWQNSTGMQSLGTLSGVYSGFSTASAVNNSGQVVGKSCDSNGNGHAFLWQNSTGIQDLNDLVSPYSGLELFDAKAINNFGQIACSGINASGNARAVLLLPTGNCEDRTVLPKCYTAIERLAKWDGTNWVPVTSGELSNANIHVLVHGWGAGLRTFSDNGGKIWDAKDPITGEAVNQDGYDKYTQAAQAIKIAAPGDTVVMFNWLDMSATESKTLTIAYKSRNNTDEAAGDLVDALKSACGPFNGKIQLLGMSHGARVSAFATKLLYDSGKPGSVVIDHLTFGDSPEDTPDWFGRYRISKNELDNVLPDIKVGRDANSTFVDNYYSIAGRNYKINNIVNVKLNPVLRLDPSEKHGYPLDWYSGASVFGDNLGVGWSPLLGDAYKTLAPSYEQDIVDELTLVESDGLDYCPVYFQSDMQLVTLLTKGTIANFSNGKCLTEASPAYWHAGFSKGLNDTTIEFSYQFLNAGDGDQLGIWIDDELRFIITGELVGNQLLMSDIDISDLSVGDHILSVALHNYGSANASVNVFDFTMISVPEPSPLILLCAIAVFSAIALLRKRYARA